MKVQVGTTIKAGGETVFWLSLLEAIREKCIENFIVTEGDTPVGRSRNNITRDFLKSNNDALLWIDSDIRFKPFHIECLKEHDVPIVAGLYPLKSPELKWCVNTIAKRKPEETDHLMEVKYAGTGFMLIRREVFEKIALAYPELEYVEDIGAREKLYNFWRMEVGYDPDVGYSRWLSEDWWFCEMWRRLGGKVFIDKRVTLEHFGMISYPLDKSALVLPNRSTAEVNMFCPDNMRVGMKRIMDGEYDIPKLNGSVESILDIGGNIGGFALWANKRWPKASITSYEPVPSNCKMWEENCRDIPGAVLVRAAVTDRPGPVKIFQPKTNCGAHSLHDLGEQNLDAALEVQAVPPASLPTADFVKIDTEGCELEILRGLDTSRTKGVALEWHSRGDRDAIRDLLTGRGFSVVSDKEWYNNGTQQRGVMKLLKAE